MPNWCSNQLTVSGCVRDLKKFFRDNSYDPDHPVESWIDVDGKEIPPDVVKEIVEDFESKDLTFMRSVCFGPWNYNKALQYWGTKWDACDPIGTCYYEDNDPDDSTGEIVYQFSTAWSPPTDWLEVVAKKNPDLEFKIFSEEEGMDFIFEIHYIEGEVQFECTQSYSEYWINKYNIPNYMKQIMHCIVKYHMFDLMMDIYAEKYEDEYSICDFESLLDQEMNELWKGSLSPEHLQGFEEISQIVNELMFNCDREWLFFREMDSIFEDKMPILKKFFNKVLGKVILHQQRKKIHFQKYKDAMDAVSKVGYCPPLHDCNPNLFVNHIKIEYLKNGGTIYQQLLEEIA